MYYYAMPWNGQTLTPSPSVLCIRKSWQTLANLIVAGGIAASVFSSWV